MNITLRFFVAIFFAGLAVSCTKTDTTSGSSVKVGVEKMNSKHFEVRSMKNVRAYYTSSEQDWLEFLSCWTSRLIRDEQNTHGDSDILPLLKRNSENLTKLGSPEYFNRIAALDQLEKKLNYSHLPPSFRHFATISGGNFIASRNIDSSVVSNMVPIDGVGLFKDIDAINWGGWHSAVGAVTPELLDVPANEYYRYNDSQDRFRWSYLDQLVKVGELEQGAILLINPREITADGEWEAWLLSTQVGAQRYRSFAELMQTVAYQEINQKGGVNIEMEKLKLSCGGHLKTAATLFSAQ